MDQRRLDLLVSKVESSSQGERNKTTADAAWCICSSTPPGPQRDAELSALRRAAMSAGLPKLEIDAAIRGADRKAVPDVVTEINPSAPPKSIGDWAAHLGVKKEGLEALGAESTDAGLVVQSWDSEGRQRSPQTRLLDGQKRWAKGATPGLFIPRHLRPRGDLWMPPKIETLWVVEGASDCAALTGLGLDAVGLPAASQGFKDLFEFVGSLSPRRLALVEDQDQAGRASVIKLMTKYQLAVKVAPPRSAKDSRAAVLLGATREEFESKLPKLRPWRPPAGGDMTLDELNAIDFSKHKQVWAVLGVVPEGISLWSGAPKVFKSWVALEMALAVSDGRLAFGHSTTPGDVVYYAYEDNLRRLQSRSRKLGSESHQNPKSLRFRALPTVKIASGLEENVRKWIEEHEHARLIIVDTLTRAAGKRDRAKNLQEQDLGQVEELQRIALDYGVSIVVLCHTRKSEDGDFLDAVAGSHGLTGAVDAVLGFNRVRGSTSLKIDRSGRDFEEETPIYLRVELGADRGSIRQISSAEASSTGVVREGSIKDKVLAELGGRPGGLRPIEISNSIDPAGTETTRAAVRKALGQLVADGFVYKVGEKYIRSDCGQIGLNCGKKDATD